MKQFVLAVEHYQAAWQIRGIDLKDRPICESLKLRILWKHHWYAMTVAGHDNQPVALRYDPRLNEIAFIEGKDFTAATQISSPES